jgi:mannose-6-phosphate isomerase-like protein (cupin superfamily)
MDIRAAHADGVLVAGEDPLVAATAGGHLELISEFEVGVDGHVNPHQHPTHEFYLVTAGRGLMTIAGEEREIGVGDLVVIASGAVHSLRPAGQEAIRCFCFAVADAGAPPIDYGSDGEGTPAPAQAPAQVAPGLEVRAAAAIAPSLEHRGTVAVWWIVPSRALRDVTLGGRLGPVATLTLSAGELDVAARPAQHVYAVLDGTAEVACGSERRAVATGDVVLVGPHHAHRLTGDARVLAVAYEVAA